MKKISYIYILIIIVLFSLLLYLGISKINKDKPYKVLEDNIVESMKMYYGQDTNLTKLPKDKETNKVTVDELIKFGIDIDLDVNGDKCNGYGIVTGEKISHTYKAYIKCSNYTTKNYK